MEEKWHGQRKLAAALHANGMFRCYYGLLFWTHKPVLLNLPASRTTGDYTTHFRSRVLHTDINSVMSIELKLNG